MTPSTLNRIHLSCCLVALLTGCGGGEAPTTSAGDGAPEAGSAVDGGAAEAAAQEQTDQEQRPEERVAEGIAKVAVAVIRVAPSKQARPMGVLNWGARFEVSEIRGKGKSAWMRMKGVGWINGGDIAIRRKGPPKLKFVPVPPDLDKALPYRYARVTEKKGVPVYFRPPPRGKEPDRYVRRHLKEGYFFSVDRWINIYDRRLHRTTRYWFVPREGTTMVSGPTFEGIEVTDETTMPFLWVTDPTALICPEPVAPPPDAGIEPCQRLERHAKMPYGGRKGVWYKSGGRWVSSLQVAFVDRIKSRPSGVADDERWIHVDLRNQVAALYEGDRMTFVTLISSGDDQHRTPAGTFRIESKHITTTMDNEDNLAGPFFIQDVPWVMFFRGGYGLHAAFWHDRFGLRTSHGCVNLSPPDARRFFNFAPAPEIPEGWHAIHTPPGTKGTVIHLTD